MRTFKFKSGIGTASRIVTFDDKNYTVGVMVQSNYGQRIDMLVAGVPVGEVGGGRERECKREKRKTKSINSSAALSEGYGK
jgi:D-aminopeptidase